SEPWMLIGHDLFVVLLDYGAEPLPSVKPQERKKLVVEWHGDTHVFDRDLNVVQDWFHQLRPPHGLSVHCQRRKNEYRARPAQEHGTGLESSAQTSARLEAMSTIPAQLKNTIAGRSRMEKEIGRGGMATVYLPDDLKHHRKVAIKVLHPERAASIGQDRFLREIEIAARLNHPHILPLHDSGAAEGHLYYVMPYIGGG